VSATGAIETVNVGRSSTVDTDTDTGTDTGPPVDVRVVRRRLGPGRRIRFAFWVGPVVLLAVWAVWSKAGLIDPTVLTAPWAVVEAFRDQWTNHDLLGDILASMERAGLGLAFGLLGGTVLALVSGLSRVGESLVDGPIQIKRSVPTLALVPLFVAWFASARR
jgi:sulfonate transport system permease protein